jgi:hypothetical protein
MTRISRKTEGGWLITVRGRVETLEVVHHGGNISEGGEQILKLGESKLSGVGGGGTVTVSDLPRESDER